VAGAVVLTFTAAPPAVALDNGLAQTPPMGFNDWNAFHCNVDEQLIKQTADFFVSSGLKDAGYNYVNIDDCWLEKTRSADGHLVPDHVKFPDGIKGTADYVHSRGLKLGIYEDAGTMTCAKYPGSYGHETTDAQDFADWGVDYLKYDNCNLVPGTGDTQQEYIDRYKRMRDALAATGRPIVFSLCEWGNFQPWTWGADVGNLWRTTGDISDNWSKLLSIVHQNMPLAKAAKPGAWNDPDMLEVGNGGMTDTEYRTHFSLWAEMASPLLIGTDLRKATPATMNILENKEVIAVDQDTLGVQGSVISSDGGKDVFVKPLANGDKAVALFNETDTSQTITTSAHDAGLSSTPAYALRDLWTHQTTETAGSIKATVPAHGTVMYRVSAGADPEAAAPNTTLELSGVPTATKPGEPLTVTASLTDNGRLPAEHARLKLDLPAGWTAKATSPTEFGAVTTGKTVRATWTVTEPPPDTPFPSYQVTATAGYLWDDGTKPASVSTAQTVAGTLPVQAPNRTFASTTAQFGQVGNVLGVRAAGSDVYGSTNQYGAVYLPGAEQDGTTATVRVTSQQNTNEWAKAGLMVRNDIANAGGSRGFLILAETPAHGYVMQWDADGDGQLDNSTAETGTAAYPSWLKLVRSGTTYKGYYSTDGTNWNQVGSVDVPSAAASQDVGVFATAHGSTVGEADFSDLNVGPPAGLIAVDGTAVTWPGQATPVTVTFYDHGKQPITGLRATLHAPDGWLVDPADPIGADTVPAGGHTTLTWHVTAPDDARGTATLTAAATYDENGNPERSEAAVPAVAPYNALSDAYDNIGTSNDTNTGAADVDGAGSSLSAQALAAAGATPGATLTHGGVRFTWPDVPVGQADNLVASGEAVKVPGTGSTLGFLATSTYGPASGTGTVVYTDGTSQQFTLNVPDWYSNPPSGSDPAITMTYRNRAGNVQQAHAINIFFVGVPLQSGKTVRGVVLPNVSAAAVSGSPSMHIFAIATG
jgi:regulation of enolase protein 1 (concanavalin A-like superfamily)